MDECATPHPANDTALARGTSVLFDVCAEALLNEPDETTIGDIQCVAHALGDLRFDDFGPSAALTQRFFDRFIVTSSRWFIPLSESCMRGYCTTATGAHYGGTNSAMADHALRCYESVGFDWKRLQGYRPLTEILRADALAVECAFVAFLKQEESCAADKAIAQHLNQLAHTFLSYHLNSWVRTAALCCTRAEDDFYARIVSFAADATDQIM